MKLYIQIPASYEDNTLTIKALNLSAPGWPAEEAYLNIAKNSPDLYSGLILGKLVKKDDKHFIVLPYNDKVYSRILELEPLPEDAEKKRKKQSHLLDLSPEDLIKYGY